MGLQASKPDSEVSFTINSKFDVSDDILSKLQESSETDFSRREDAERFIEKRVSQRLVELEKETLKKFEDKLDSSLLLVDVDNDPLSSKSLDEKIENLNKKLTLLQERDQDKKLKLEGEPLEIRKKLTKCLKDNKGKPLNCYEYIEQFKRLTAEA